jgi:hypothetical protein
MRALDDILFGFLIFFSIDRFIRLLSNGLVGPWAEKRTADKTVVDNWKLGVELALLMTSCYLVYRYRYMLGKLNTR